MDKAEIYYDNQQRFASFQVADSGHVRQLQHLYDFVTLRTGFRDLNPAQPLVGTPNLCLANPGREYVVYAPAGGELSLDLTGTSGSFSVGRLNPHTGAYEGRAWIEGGARRAFTAPDPNDWVLHLKKVDDRVQAGWQQRLAQAARSPESWRARREEIRRQILVAAGLWPEFERPPVKAVVTGQLGRDGYTLKKVYLQTWPGFYLPGLRIGLNNVEIAAATAPRPLLLVSATGDWTKYTPVLEGPAIHGVYEALGVDDRFRCVQFVAPHNYNRDSRAAVYPWFARWLGNAPMAERLAEPPLKAEPHESLEVFTAAHPRPKDAVDTAGLDALLQERIRRQLDALWPRDAASWERFRRIMAPALRCALAAEWPGPDEMEATQAPATTRSFSTISLHLRGLPTEIELLASAATDKKRFAWLLVTCTAQETESVLQELRRVGSAPVAAPAENASWRHDAPAVFVLRLRPHERESASGGNEEQRHQYVSTYYRTALAWQVQDVLTALAYLTGQAGFTEVRLAGLDAAGVPVLLARALEPTGKVSVTIADLGGLDDDEATWTGARAQPGMLRLGGLRTAAILAAPGQLVLHHAGAHFDAAAPRTAYRAIGVAPSLEISESPWNVGTVLERLGASDRPDRKGKEGEN